MSLYNLLFGVNQYAGVLLDMLNLKPDDFGRFRDAYLNADGTKIIVYTRCGGSNREEYDYVFAEMAEHDQFITEYDDDFDCTYAYFEFKVPEKFLKQTKLMANGEKPETIHEKFTKATKDIENNPDSEYLKKMKPMMDKIKEAFDDKDNNGGVILV